MPLVVWWWGGGGEEAGEVGVKLCFARFLGELPPHVYLPYIFFTRNELSI